MSPRESQGVRFPGVPASSEIVISKGRVLRGVRDLTFLMHPACTEHVGGASFR